MQGASAQEGRSNRPYEGREGLRFLGGSAQEGVEAERIVSNCGGRRGPSAGLGGGVEVSTEWAALALRHCPPRYIP